MHRNVCLLRRSRNTQFCVTLCANSLQSLILTITYAMFAAENTGQRGETKNYIFHKVLRVTSLVPFTEYFKHLMSANFFYSILSKTIVTFNVA